MFNNNSNNRYKRAFRVILASVVGTIVVVAAAIVLPEPLAGIAGDAVGNKVACAAVWRNSSADEVAISDPDCLPHKP